MGMAHGAAEPAGRRYTPSTLPGGDVSTRLLHTTARERMRVYTLVGAESGNATTAL